MNVNNIWEIAEACQRGTLTPAQQTELDHLMATDSVFAEQFQESMQLLASLNNSGKQRRFKALLQDVHQEQVTKKKALRIQLPPHFLRITATAASVALIVSFINYFTLVNSNGKRNEQYNTISREVEHIKKDVQRQKEQQAALLDSLAKIDVQAAPRATVKYTGTGFALTNDGYFVTSYHVVNDGKGDFDSVYIESSKGHYYKASLVNVDKKNDIAIMKVTAKNFHFANNGDIPYTFAAGKLSLGADIFTLGYPVNDAVYSEGYISSRNGFNGDENQYTLELPAGHGQSGSPVVDGNGNVIGILTAIGTPQQANTYAVSSRALLELVATIPNYKTLHLPRHSKMGRMGRQQQIALLEDFTFSVKVYK